MLNHYCIWNFNFKYVGVLNVNIIIIIMKWLLTYAPSIFGFKI
jgi:hypothetical protein